MTMLKLARILLVVATGLAVLAAPPAGASGAADQPGAAARASFSWGNAKSVLPRIGEVTGAACRTNASCVATLDSGHVVWVTNGKGGEPLRVSSHKLVAVSCGSSSFCVAVGDDGEAVTWNGHKWRARTIDAGRDLTSVSCATATSCVAGDTTGRVARWNGTSWSVTKISDGIAEVSCGTKNLCFALDTAGALFRSRPSGWQPSDVGGGAEVGHVACASASFCLATAGFGNAWEFDGDTWTAQEDANVRDGALACASDHLCVSVEPTPFDVATIFDGTDWETADYSPFERMGEIAAACGPASCLVLDVTRARRYDGTGWVYQRVVSPHGGDLFVDCPKAGFCAIVDDKAAKTWNGTKWSKAKILANDPVPNSGFQGRVFTTGLACPAVDVCHTTLVDQEFLIDFASPSAQKWNGTSWNDVTFPSDRGALTANLACGSPTACIASGLQVQEGTPNDEAYWFKLDGGGWSRALNTRQSDITDITCPTASVCAFAVTREGSGWVGFGDTSGFGELVEVSPTPLTHLSCSAATSCMALNGAGRSFEYDGTTWRTRPRTDLPGNPSGVSCASSSFCQAIDDTGFAARWNGTTWTTPKRLVKAPLTDVSCASTSFCVAVAEGGKAVIGRG